MKRKILLAALLILAAVAAVIWWRTRPLPILTVTTWAGAYGRAQAHAMTEPFGAAAHIDVRLTQWDGDLKEVETAVANHIYKGDVIDFELPKAVEACKRGLLERFDPAFLPAGDDGVSAQKDFVPGALGPCFVGSVVYSQAILFAGNKFTDSEPATLKDFFDTARFPGPRALNRAPKFNLEMALLADGVAPAQVYATLATPEGLERALRKLDTIKPGLVWWRASGEPAQLIAGGQAVFSTALNGAVFDGRLAHVIWDRQLYEMDVFGIPAGDPKKERALDFIRFSTSSGALAGVAAWVPYGPARRSAWNKVGQNPDLHVAMQPWLPTSHFATAFQVDDSWWLEHGDAVKARWQAWMDTH